MAVDEAMVVAEFFKSLLKVSVLLLLLLLLTFRGDDDTEYEHWV